MRGKVAKRLRLLAETLGHPKRHVYRQWKALPRNAPRPGRRQIVMVPVAGGLRLPRVLKVTGRSLEGVNNAIVYADDMRRAHEEAAREAERSAERLQDGVPVEDLDDV